jgi:hypothetical protein
MNLAKTLPAATLLAALWLTGCAEPCRAVALQSAHRAELQQCDRLTQYREDMLRCIADVQARYVQQFAELGADAVDEIERVRDELAEDDR